MILSLALAVQKPWLRQGALAKTREPWQRAGPWVLARGYTLALASDLSLKEHSLG